MSGYYAQTVYIQQADPIRARSSQQKTMSSSVTDYTAVEDKDRPADRYGSTEINDPKEEAEDTENDGLMRQNPSCDTDETSETADSDERGIEMTVEELIYSSTSYYAIAQPVTITMVLAALAVVFVNDDDTREAGQEAMASAYQYFDVDGTSSGANLAHSVANALIMVSVIAAMTFVIVFLYRMKCMKCLIGYMILCSCSLLGLLGGNMLSIAFYIYSIPVDKPTFYLFVFNFAFVGVLAVFFGSGIPKYITQGYLIATAVILAWHLSFFDEWTTWTLLFMLALYDLCAVLTPCGPLKFLVEAMSQDDSPEMPGLLFEAELPPDAKRPSGPKTANTKSSNAPTQDEKSSDPLRQDHPTNITIPLAIAKVYQLAVISVPPKSMPILFPQHNTDATGSSSPLLLNEDSNITVPDAPTSAQLQALVVVRLPPNGGRIEQVKRRGRKVYLERDRHGNPKRILWVDRNGKVFAEMKEDDEDGPERNSIRLGLGDFIFYSLLVAKAAQYSFATFAACTLVILSGLGGTLFLLSVYHHALPALPISICLGVVVYFLTRFLVEPWVEAVLNKPYYV